MDEFDIIERYFNVLTSSSPSVLIGIGDDAALVQPSANQSLVIATDSLVENTHFSSFTPADAIAQKLVVSNISDLTACAAIPKWATLSLTLPMMNESWLKAFSQSLHQQLQHYGISLVGGDTTKGKELHVSMTVIGECQRSDFLSRHGAQVGDMICLCGHIGESALGLSIEQHLREDANFIINSSHPQVLERLLHHFYYPQAQVEIGRIMKDYASTMIDISDGLLQDLRHIIRSSQTQDIPLGVNIDFTARFLSDDFKQGVKLLFNHHGLSKDKKIQNSEQIALTSGEEYTLCVTLSPTEWKRLQQDQHKGLISTFQLYTIGEITDSSRWIVNGCPLELDENLGYRHF